MDLTDEDEKKGLSNMPKNIGTGYNVLLNLLKQRKELRLLPFIKGEISVFAGQSGVGKSSLLNVLRPDLR